MGKTHRNARHWWENRFKYGDPRYPEDTSFFDKRYQMKIRYETNTWYHEKLDPRSMKIIHWAEMGKSYKAYAKRVARHAAKIMVRIEAHIIMQEVWDDYWADMWSEDEEDDDWYENHSFVQDWEMESYREEYDYYYDCDYDYRDPWDLYY